MSISRTKSENLHICTSKNHQIKKSSDLPVTMSKVSLTQSALKPYPFISNFFSENPDFQAVKIALNSYFGQPKGLFLPSISVTEYF